MVVVASPCLAVVTTLREWRCRGCRRLLMLVQLSPGSRIECQCRCGVLNVVIVDNASE